MDIELQLGDKIWMNYGAQAFIVGYVVDHSPDYSMIALSPLPYDEYDKMSLMEKASAPITWCETKVCSYIAHTKLAEIRKHDANRGSHMGFSPSHV
jgi:hypothetical protein